MNKKKSYLYIPVEISAREIDSKLLIALKAVKNGFTVVLGRKAPLIKHVLRGKPGIFLSIWGAHKNFKNLYKDIKEKGHNIAAVDEEGLITLSDENYLRLKMDPKTLDYIDIFFTWGEAQNNKLILNRQSSSHKFLQAGNPRLEMLKSNFNSLYENDMNEIKSLTDKYVLIVSSFGFSNHYDGSEAYLKQLESDGVIRNKKEEIAYKDYFNFQNINFKEFIDATKTLATKYPDTNFIYRKHPAEDPLSLDKYFSDFKNILLIHDKSIIPWIKSSICVIHNYCTTAIEAQILGVPSIGYRPFKDESIESNLPYLNSKELFYKDDLVSHVGSLISSKIPLNNFDSSKLNNHIYGLDQKDSSSDIMIQSLRRLIPSNSSLDNQEMKQSYLSNIFKIKRFVRRIINKKESYVDHKFQGVNVDQINKKLNKISTIISLKHCSLSLKEVSNEVYIIEKKD